MSRQGTQVFEIKSKEGSRRLAPKRFTLGTATAPSTDVTVNGRFAVTAAGLVSQSLGRTDGMLERKGFDIAGRAGDRGGGRGRLFLQRKHPRVIMDVE